MGLTCKRGSKKASGTLSQRYHGCSPDACITARRRVLSSGRADPDLQLKKSISPDYAL